MGRLIPFGNIPDSNVFPDGIYRLKITKLEEKMTKERDGKVAKLMYVLTSQVVEPASHKGLLYFENFVIGTEDDAEADEVSTWQTSIGGRSLKRLTKALGVPFGDEEDAEAFAETVKGAEYLATIIQKVEPDEKNGQPNPYKGRINNNTTAFWKLGEKDAGLVEDRGGNGTVKTVKRATKPAGGDAKPAPSDEVTCTACRKRVPRKELKAHVDQHMKELAGDNGAGADDE